MSKVDMLAFGVHPDDVELGCAGTLLRHISMGRKAAIVDLTRGELGTRGNTELREKEAGAAAKILGVAARENLEMADGFFQNDKEHQLKVIAMIRKYRPEIVLANAIYDRHPDHGRAAKLIADSCFLAGLVKIETWQDGKLQEPWRPKVLYHYIQDKFIKPNLLVDISEFFDKKMEAIMAYRSQFFDAASKEPATYISSSFFLESEKGKAALLGKSLGARYAEGFIASRTMGVDDLFNLR